MESERILLRPWREDDAPALFKYASDPEVGPRAGWPPHQSVEESREIIRTIFSNDRTWAIELKESGEPVGCIGYFVHGESNIDIGENDAEAGYWVARPYWNRGIATEALRLMLDYCFGEKGFDTIWSDFFVDNPASGRVMEKCGFRDTGGINYCSRLQLGSDRPVKVMRLDRNPLLRAMLAQADPSQVEGLSRFFKTGPGQYGEGDKFLGIKVPVTRAVVKACWKETSVEDLEACIASEFHEVRLAALLTLVEIFAHAKRSSFAGSSSSFAGLTGESPRQHCIDFYLSHTAYINNWDLVDLSCYPLLGVWLLDKDRSLLYELARNGKTLWEQRIGIVSTMTFIRHGQLDDTFAIADILLHHPHDLIHKAVGWLLREAGKRDKAALKAFLQPRYRTMPRTMLRYAIEKFPEAERQAYLKPSTQ